MNRRNRFTSDGDEALLVSRPSTLQCPSPLEMTEDAFNLATNSSSETGHTNSTSTTLLPFPNTLSTSAAKSPFIHPPTPLISHAPRLSVCRLTVVNKINNEAIVDHIRVEAHQHDTIEDVLKEICRAKQIRKKNSVRLLNYHGHELDTKSTLAHSGLHDLSVVHLCTSDTCSEPELVEEVINLHQKQLLTAKYCAYLNKWTIFAAILFFIFLCGIIVLISFFVLQTLGVVKVSKSYAIVIDAGSTSSKIHLYSYKSRRKLHSTSPVEEEIALCKTKSPLTDYGTDGKGENRVLDEIVACITDTFSPKVPIHARKNTDVYLGATAGMRMLKHDRPVEAENILNSLRSELLVLGFRIVDPEERIRVISGNEEGLYAWITSNYLLGTFGKKVDKSFQPKRAHVEETYGALDLGGASTQIAFAVNIKNQSIDHEAFLNNLTLFDETYSVYSHSFLCFGREKTHARIMSKLLQDANFSTSVELPCLQDGSDVVKNAKYIFNECTWGKLSNNTFGMEIAPPSWVTRSTLFTFRGTGDEAKCQEMIKPLFPVNVCHYEQCSFHNVYQPPVRGNFLAFSSFYFTFKHLNLLPNCTMTRFKNALTALCRTKVDRARFEPMTHSAFYCLDGNYMMNLLQHYGFNESNWESIEYVSKIGPSAVSWTLGYMLYHTNFLPDTMSRGLLPYVPFIIGLCLCFLLLVFAMLLCYRGLRTTPKKSENVQEIHLILADP